MHTNPEVLALRALGEDVGTPAERDHIDACPTCSEEVAELARLAHVGRSATTSEALATPSPAVWERIRTELGFDQPDADPTRTADVSTSTNAPTATVSDISGGWGGSAARSTPPRRTSASRRFLALAVAAALALVVGIGVGVGYERQSNRPRERVIARAELNALPQWQGATGTAEVLADGTGNRVLVLKMSTPKPVVGTREVWLIDTQVKGMKSMGVMSDSEARFEIPRGMSLFRFPIVDVSDEPPNDPSPAHSGNSIVRGQLE